MGILLPKKVRITAQMERSTSIIFFRAIRGVSSVQQYHSKFSHTDLRSSITIYGFSFYLDKRKQGASPASFFIDIFGPASGFFRMFADNKC